MKQLWPVWRLVVTRTASLAEIEASWSINDIWDANAALDAYQRAMNQE